MARKKTSSDAAINLLFVLIKSLFSVFAFLVQALLFQNKKKPQQADLTDEDLSDPPTEPWARAQFDRTAAVKKRDISAYREATARAISTGISERQGKSLTRPIVTLIVELMYLDYVLSSRRISSGGEPTIQFEAQLLSLLKQYCHDQKTRFDLSGEFWKRGSNLERIFKTHEDPSSAFYRLNSALRKAA